MPGAVADTSALLGKNLIGTGRIEYFLSGKIHLEPSDKIH
jgi:hypothetical protein